ncbi:aminoacyl-tRNA hydrolase [Kosmotoga pacifica]|uniref:Peptidyl-tRNA hydrolase n=1 Tax=Kosmotoga pacifica TaxID=1330330 RepID=A0A0G2ZDI9_9BACT|nr:aminoacyl-tRNA hydrolase [Kosmotoga pacifica]AKI96888.1 peptidyl-tRNA hydrolase [Kosmotoga pacifica]
MRVFIGLGNPGPRYVLTRHNVGFLFIDEILKQSKLISTYETHLYLAHLVEFNQRNKALLVKPMTFMNLSGIAVKRVCQEFNVHSFEEIIVAYDDIWIPLGKIRIRKNGSDGGHNGLKSIINSLETMSFPRIRIGIGPKPEKNLTDYVLGEFTSDELSIIGKVLKLTTEAAKELCQSDISKVMSKYNSLEVG